MKPVKPSPDFELTPHARGGWQKKYKGRVYYVAPHDPQEAREAWYAIKRAIDADLPAPKVVRMGKGLTVGRIANRYDAQRGLDFEAGKLTHGEYELYRRVLRFMVKGLGRDTLYRDLTPGHFTRMYRRWEALDIGNHALANRVKVVRACWRFADDQDWIPHMPKFGRVFKKPATGKRQGKPPHPFDVLRIAACSENLQVEAMILLMMNGAYTAKDCAALPREAVDFARGVVVFPRPKMERRQPIDRAFVLWPETAEVLREVMARRPDDTLVFRTHHGNPWVRGKFSRKGKGGIADAVSWPFRKTCTALGLKPFGPSWIRHVWRTIADELEKPHAAARVLGHRLPGMAEVYVHAIEVDRLKVITDHVRRRFLSRPDTDPANQAPTPPPAPSS